MKVLVLRNLGRDWPAAKEGQSLEVSDEMAAELIAASLAEPLAGEEQQSKPKVISKRQKDSE